MKNGFILFMIIFLNISILSAVKASDTTGVGTIQTVLVGDVNWVNFRLEGVDVVNPLPCPKQNYYGIDKTQAHYEQLYAAILTARITSAKTRLTLHPTECSGQWGAYPKVIKVEMVQ